MSALCAAFFERWSQSIFFIRWMTTGQRKQRVDFLQHFFFGFSCATFAGLVFPMAKTLAQPNRSRARVRRAEREDCRTLNGLIADRLPRMPGRDPAAGLFRP